MKKIFIPLVMFLFLSGCKKDYANFPSPFYKGEVVNLNGINPRDSPVPYPCCICPCYVDSVYLDSNYPVFWFYNIHDEIKGDRPLTHVANNQLKKW